MKIKLPLKLCPEFTGIRDKFADLIDDVARAMQNISYDELKRYICFRDRNLRPEINECENTDDIMQLISDRCSLIDIALLESVVRKFKIEQAKLAIQYYKDEIENFYQEGRPLRQFLDNELSLSSPLQCETATITVNKAIDDYELKDIDVLMTYVFEAIAPNVKVVVVREDNFIDDICIAGETTSFLLQSDSPQFNWEEYGMRITIPQGAIPLCIDVKVTITALVGGEFILPKYTELVSAVYAISVSKPLLKPVQLEIQHCVSIEKPAHSNYLSFATAPSDCPPYQFKFVKGGDFFPGDRYGSIYLSQFSVCCVTLKSPATPGIQGSSSSSSSSIVSSHTDDFPPFPLNNSLLLPTSTIVPISGNVSSLFSTESIEFMSGNSMTNTFPTLSLSSSLPSSHIIVSSSQSNNTTTASSSDTKNTVSLSSSNRSATSMSNTTVVPSNFDVNTVPVSTCSTDTSTSSKCTTISSLSSNTDTTTVYSPSDRVDATPLRISSLQQTANSMYFDCYHIYYVAYIDTSPSKCYYFQVMHDSKRSGRKWVTTVIFSKDLNAVKKVYITLLKF